MNIVAAKFHLDTKATEDLRDQSQHIDTAVLDRDLRLCHRRKANETPDLDHIGQAGMFCAVKHRASFYRQKIRTDTRDLRTHAIEHSTQLLQVWFTRSIIDRRRSF